MDARFPHWLRNIVRKLDFLGMPNLGMFVCGLTVLGYFGQNFLGAPLERFIFDPYMVLQGEWWRIVAFPTGDGTEGGDFFVNFTLDIDHNGAVAFPAPLSRIAPAGGLVYGSSDKTAGYVKDSPVRPEDFGATLFHALDVPPEMKLGADGFTKPVSAGKPVLDLFG